MALARMSHGYVWIRPFEGKHLEVPPAVGRQDWIPAGPSSLLFGLNIFNDEWMPFYDHADVPHAFDKPEPGRLPIVLGQSVQRA